MDKSIPRPTKFWRVRTPTVIQMENVECGAACLSILLSHYGKHVSLEELRQLCGVSRDGSNALNLLNAAKGLGLEGKGCREGLSELYETERVSILFWEYNHFVVLEGFGKEGVYINDPAFGPKMVTYEEFDEGYTGVVLHFEKSHSFQKGGKQSSVTKDIIERFKGVKKSLLYVIIAGFCLLIPGLGVPVFTRIFVDNILVTNVLPWKGQFLMAIFIALALAGILTWLQQYFLNRLNVKMAIKFSSDFLWYILRLPVSFYYQRFPAEIANRVGQNNLAVQMLTGVLATPTIQVILVVFYGIVMFMYDFSVALIGILAGLGSLFVMLYVQRSRTDTYARLQKQQAMVWANSVGVIQQIETVKATGTESDAFAAFSGYDTNKINSLQEISRKDAILTTSPVLFQGLAQAALLGIGGWRTMDGALTIGTLMALQMLLISFITPIINFINVAQTIQFLKTELIRLNDVMKNPLDELYSKSRIKTTSKPKFDGYLEFKDVTYGYSPLAPPLINKLSIKIKPGQRVALVGPSGCGKSTISKLSSGLIKPWEGEVLFDGKPIMEHSPEIMHRSLSSVDQEIFLFSGTIRENITLWDKTVEDEVLIKAASDACIHSEILERPEGYETELIEGGRNLSGGQRQRLEIARSLLVNPSILIMDEATSALDSNTEKMVMNHIRKRGCSAIMVAHRLSTIQDCDEIIVLDQGQVIERGTHEGLKKLGGMYSQMTETEAGFDESAF
ncbi:MAG: NHLP family bacteriocin export ABC transporter peptidase/permease/ATPase subunit [Simkaniaceae bacterium]|nr:NHLP family bacteriocin export ABC transporter peptidase/permease/ATPase subunit [Simkaniaceae bacterium]